MLLRLFSLAVLKPATCLCSGDLHFLLLSKQKTVQYKILVFQLEKKILYIGFLQNMPDYFRWLFSRMSVVVLLTQYQA